MEAVKFFKGREFEYVKQNNDEHLIIQVIGTSDFWKRDNDDLNLGDFSEGFTEFNKNLYTKACTVKEYNQCIKEMSEAKWMQKTVEELMLSAREEAEIKVAKEKQIDSVITFCNKIAERPEYTSNGLKYLFSEMQKAGMLAEILLPLESK